MSAFGPCFFFVLSCNALLGAGSLLRGNRTQRDMFCLEGKGAPQVYLLGAQKAGTTSMDYDFMRIGLSRAGLKKELHPFNWVCRFLKPGKWPLASLLGSKPSGACPETVNADVRHALARKLNRQCGWPGLYDASPDALRIPGLPKMIHSLYGAHSSSLVFVVLLREPMHRTYSSFHQHSFASKQFKAVHPTFQGYITAVRGSGRLPKYREAEWKWAENDYSIDIIYRSMYGLQFKHWLEPTLFQARQFIVAPMGKYFGNAELTRGLLAHVGNRLNMNLRLDMVHSTTETHVSSYLPLEYALDVGSKRWLNQFFEEDTQHLCELFAEHHQDGLDLYDFEGPATVEKIQKYLNRNW